MQPPAPVPVPPEPFEWLGANPAEWSTAGIALLALIVAAAAAWGTLRTNRAQQETLALQQRQYDEQQAGQISYWTRRHGVDEVELFIVNASSMPISDVMLIVGPLTPEREKQVDLEWPTILFDRRIILPGGSKPVKNRKFKLESEIAKHVLTHAELALAFTDGRGAVWFRNEANELWSPSEKDKRVLLFCLQFRRAKPAIEAIMKFEDEQRS